MKRVLAWLAALVMALCVWPAQAQTTDNWYEVFVYSFADGNGDRIGDFQGLTEKLDYIDAMGFGGIWLMPIHPSPSYHKYDVTDYYDIHPEYGTLEDFQAFLARAHELGIRVIIDLVVNHTSNQHPWFQSACEGEASPYREYYNFQSQPQSGYTALPDGSYYESRFVSTMPDLNLDSPKVRAEIQSILRYWLDMGVDGFRLDAVTSYYTGSREKNQAFLSWLCDTARSIREDCFIVGECWEDLYTIADYSGCGPDCFFTFPVAQASGYVAKILGPDVERKGESYGNVVSLLQRELGVEGMAPFLGNHDTNRIAGAVGYYNPTNVKMACGLAAMLNGPLFVYYGDEIGMIGDGNDPNKRIGMFWDKKMNITRCPPGTTVAEYPFAPVVEQWEDSLSILSYYRNAMALRNEHPAIARGTPTVLDSPDANLCLIRKDYDGQSLLIALNLSVDDLTFDLPQGFEALVGELEIWGSAAVEDGALTVPAYGIALFE